VAFDQKPVPSLTAGQDLGDDFCVRLLVWVRHHCAPTLYTTLTLKKLQIFLDVL
jgi:hypothetical protein